MRIRRPGPSDVAALVEMQQALWPDATLEELRAETEARLTGRLLSTLPSEWLLAEEGERALGFVEVGLRSHADGCDPQRPCGFLEGWYVAPETRRRGVGRALVSAAEAWCQTQGCTELASDTWFDQTISEQAHLALGFELVDRCLHFRKALPPPTGPQAQAWYGQDLAQVHHQRFGMVAEGAAQLLLRALEARQLGIGTVVDLAAGSGILSRALSEAGHRVLAVDLSPDMLAVRHRALSPEVVHAFSSGRGGEVPVCGLWWKTPAGGGLREGGAAGGGRVGPGVGLWRRTA